MRRLAAKDDVAYCPDCGVRFPSFQTYCSACGFRVLVKRNPWVTLGHGLVIVATLAIALAFAVWAGYFIIWILWLWVGFVPSIILSIVFGLLVLWAAIAMLKATGFIRRR